MRTFVRGFNIPLKVPAYVLNGAHGHRANDLHVQSSSMTWPANARVLEGCMFADAPSTHERAWMCLPRFKNDTLTSCLRLVFSLSPPAQSWPQKLQNRRGANSTHPGPRYREAPVTESTPSRARVGACSIGFCDGLGKFAVFEAARSRSYAKFVL